MTGRDGDGPPGQDKVRKRHRDAARPLSSTVRCDRDGDPRGVMRDVRGAFGRHGKYGLGGGGYDPPDNAHNAASAMRYEDLCMLPEPRHGAPKRSPRWPHRDGGVLGLWPAQPVHSPLTLGVGPGGVEYG